MAYDGIQNTNKVNSMTQRKLRAKVIDTYLSSRTLMARLQGMAKPFRGKTMDIIHDIAADDQFEYISGLEVGAPTRSDTTITTSYAHAAARQPRVSVMLDSFANSGAEQEIDVDDFNYEKAARDMVFKAGTDLYTNTGTGKQWHGLASVVDDGTNAASIGGQSRTTYTELQAHVQAATAGNLSLVELAEVKNSIRAAGMVTEEPTIIVTGKGGTALYEQLLTPTVTQNYRESGGLDLPLRGFQMRPRAAAEAKGGLGFNAYAYAGIPMVEDDGAADDEFLFLNEHYLYWAGRSIVPDKWKGVIEKVSLGSPSTIDGVSLNMPSEFHGFFFQKDQVMPNQAGMVGWFYIIGQLICESFRRQGKLEGATAVA